MKLNILILCFFASITTFAQKKISFKDKKIVDLNVNMGQDYWVEEFPPTFPSIWNDFSSNSDDYIFSGYYTIDLKSDTENEILNGEVKLIRLHTYVAEGTLHIKEELVFNFKNNAMSGPVRYNQFYADVEETDDDELKNKKWEKVTSITANYTNSGGYQNIVFNEFLKGDRTNYIITQTKRYNISLDYFQTIIELNTCLPNEKPVFKKLKY
jgi:hypothetical protein